MNSPTIDQVITELGAYFRTHAKEIVSMFYKSGEDSEILKRARKITSVQGKYPAFHAVTDHVIQNFRAQWDEFGSTTIKVNELQAYHLKVNFPIVPANVLNSWLAEDYDEDASLEDKSISKFIMNNELNPKIVEDLVELIVTGEYDSVNGFGVFGKSMDGVQEVIRKGLLDTDNPMYKIGIPTITDDNIVDVVTMFERAIPTKGKKKIKEIFMTTKNAERYALRYEALFGTNTLIKDGDYFKTRLGKRVIVPVDEMTNDQLIWTTPPGNMVRTINKFDMPKLTDIQKLDYKIKLFFESWDGIGFWINQAVFASVTSGSGSGLGATEDLYY
jgi:hypothetical protein